jgi:hypothetical protein
MRIRIALGLIAWVVLGNPLPSWSRSAEEDPVVTAFLQRHCVDCHGPDTQKGGLRIDAFTLRFPDDASLERGIRIFDRVRRGEMPPKKSAAPPAPEHTAFLNPLGAALEKADRALAGPARSSLRRLNRVEIEETLRDLLALPALRVKEELPEDGRRHGFDKVAGALDLSHVQVSKILAVADKALHQAVAGQAERPELKRWREPAIRQDSAQLAIRTINGVPLKGHDLAEGYATKVEGDPVKDPANCYRVGTFKGESDTLAIFSGPLGAHQPQGIQPDHFRPTTRGWYRVRFSVWGLRWERTTSTPAVQAKSRIVKAEEPRQAAPEGPELVHIVRASLAGTPLEYFDAPSLKPTVHEFTVWLEPRQVVSFHAMTLPAHGPPNWSSHDGPRSYEGPGVAFDWFEVEGPLLDQWPPEGHRRLFGEGKTGTEDLLRSFAERAFRRPVAAAEVESYAALTADLTKRGFKPEEALLGAYRAILVSPDFLFLGLEGSPEATLASRLSYLLWNSAPDEALTALARSGNLSRPEVLRAQVGRMLQDPKSARFVSHFLDEWLEMRNIDFTTPDPHLYPDFDPWLRDAMLEETRGTFRRMLDQDRSVVHLVASDDLLINQRLAELYGIPGVTGAKLRSVPLPEGNPRGGLLTQAAVLKVTANGTATSPVLRGVWISERLLGLPRNPPPPNIPAIEPDARGAVTIRQMIEKHRADPTCASCHAKMDPPGLALESFDAIGAWRDRYRVPAGDGKPKVGLPVDSTGTLPDGRTFNDVRDLRRLLAADPDALARNLIRELLIYGTGVGLRYSDRAEIDAILSRVAARKYGLRSLLEEVAVSRIFRGGEDR